MKTRIASRIRTALLALAPTLGLAAGAAAQGDPHAERMTRGKLDADLGNAEAAAEAFTALAADNAAPPALRGEALVRLGLVRQRGGDRAGSLAAFEQAMREYSTEEEVVRLLVLAVGDVLPGKARWDPVWRDVVLVIDETDRGRPALRIQWPGMPLHPSSAGKVVRLASKQPVRYTGHPISLDFMDGDLQDIFRLFADITGLNVVVSPASGGRVTLKFENVPWEQALDRILAASGYAYRLEGRVLRIARPEQFPSEAARKFTGKAVSVDFKEGELHDVLQQVASHGRVAVNVAPTVKGRVTMRLQDVPWDQAFDVIVWTHNLGWSREGNTIQVGPRDPIRDR